MLLVLNNYELCLFGLNNIEFPAFPSQLSAKLWFVTSIDDHTRLIWIFLIYDKFKVSSIFQNFYHIVKHSSLQRLQSYKVTMDMSFKITPLMSVCPLKGLSTKISVLTPSNKMRLSREQSSPFESKMFPYVVNFHPSDLWDDVVLTIVAHLIN